MTKDNALKFIGLLIVGTLVFICFILGFRYVLDTTLENNPERVQIEQEVFAE